MISLILFVSIVSVVLLLVLLKRKRRVKVANQGIETYDASNNITFSTENRLFKYIGYKDLPIGRFSITAGTNVGNVVFIPITLSTNNQELSHQVAIAVDMPYISEARVSGNTFTGTVKSPMDFRYEGNLRTKPLIRICYGVY